MVDPDPKVVASQIRGTSDVIVSENRLKATRKEQNTQKRIAEMQKRAMEDTASGQRRMGSAQLLNARTGQFVEARNTARWLMPLISGVVVVFVIVGPGMAAAMKLLSSIPWYLWIGIIFVGLLLWRNR